MPDPDAMLRSLRGLSVGDALGQAFFVDRGEPGPLIDGRLLPPGPWPWSDDTVMAQAIVDVLTRHGRIDQDALAASFTERFLADTERGYGAVAYWLLHQLGAGRPWREVSRQVFSGQGSLGNGSAMRVAPLGAYLSEDLDRVQREARASAEVTHVHPDGIAGAEAVALCTAELVRAGAEGCDGARLLERIAERITPGETRDGVARAAGLLGQPPDLAARELGDGRLVRCSDTVPFSLWCAVSSPWDYEEAIWLTLRGLESHESDRDTVLAIVGGVVGALADPPAAWVEAREALPT
ncbi:MAG: ADP-ribosylglycohydrolase family protein [Planctomycetota bacterium]